MAWITPVTDRVGSTPKTTAADMNRIVGNIAHLGGSPVKSSYEDTDIVQLLEWYAIVSFAQVRDPSVTMSTRWDNLNKIEAAILDAKENGFILGETPLGGIL